MFYHFTRAAKREVLCNGTVQEQGTFPPWTRNISNYFSQITVSKTAENKFCILTKISFTFFVMHGSTEGIWVDKNVFKISEMLFLNYSFQAFQPFVL